MSGEVPRGGGADRAILDALLEGCQIVDRELRYVYVNDALVAQSRRTRDELVGKTMPACYPGIEATPMFDVLRRALFDRVPGRMQNEFSFPDGARVVYSLRFVPVPEGVCVLSLDVTHEHGTPAEIVRSSADAILTRTMDGIVTSWNEGAERLLGWTAAEMIGQPIDRLLPRDVDHAARRAAEDAVRSGEAHELEARRARKDGTIVEVWATMSPIRDELGAVTGISAIMRDVTELRRTERELARAKDVLEAANHELGAFGYSVAHDLRAPLRGIHGFTQLLVEDFGASLPPEAHEHLGHVQASTVRMERMIDDLLRLSRVGQAPIARHPIDLGALSQAIVTRLRREAPERRVELSVEPELLASGDEGLVTILLENLLGNAWKFTREREIGHVHVGARTQSEGKTFFVQDDGVGFEARSARKLFAPFQRYHGREQFEGTGIGLATVQRVVHRHGGRVRLESEPGRGTTVHFTLGV